MRKSAFLLMTLATMLGGAASPARAGFEPIEMSIPFVSHGGIRDWRVMDRDTLYVQDNGRNWYRAELMSACHDLPFSEAIGFDASGTDRFDRFSSIVVRGQRCAVKSFVASGPPPKKDKSRKS